ncbi:LysM peptidoglycan-binding domain-containing protein [Wenzhouxiangella sp. XN24]|uniref:LysM peptidoglycan-binding domain-containing protein n=1 Tax=Wenzhouxiangella sp. XN24 TaxID=2713569 RepID=UPI0013EA4282|nr:LysM peptidoglycan-binding domain-containing protein [Wenzhouxiangella sp. XN24]NGX17656.1 LysM peptidoglycan-binding domain-containing protein [Wenzhouxiangella sp. XN24]
MSKPTKRPMKTRLLSGLAAALLAAGCASTPEAPAPAPAAEPPPQQSAPPPAPSATPRAAAPVAPPPVLNPRHPERYVVRKGDTLWDISAMFLRDPWFWPEIWYANPQVENPHLIYPGDVLTLVYLDGRPRLILERGPATTERLQPRIRVEPLEDAILTVPYDRIAAFLSRPSVLDRETIDEAPYILTSRAGHLAHGSFTEVYVRGADFAQDEIYSVVNVGEPLRDPDNGRLLGYEGIYVGEGRVIRTGDPATLQLQATAREALNGDKLVPVETDFPLRFTPRPPEQEVDGRIISVLNGVARASTYQIVTLNRGTQHGLEPGHVLAVWQAGERVRDRFEGGRVDLPDEYAGNLMIFRSYEDLSYGLIMQASNEIRVLDRVRNP